jgi:hypothetical protein
MTKEFVRLPAMPDSKKYPKNYMSAWLWEISARADFHSEQDHFAYGC